MSAAKLVEKQQLGWGGGSFYNQSRLSLFLVFIYAAAHKVSVHEWYLIVDLY